MNKKKTIIFLIFAFIFLTSIYIISKKREVYTSSNLFDYIYKDYKEYGDLKGNYKNFNKEFFDVLNDLNNDLIKAKYLKELGKKDLLVDDIYDYLSIDYYKAKSKDIDVYFEQIDMIKNIHLDIKYILEDGVVDDKEYEYMNLSLGYIGRLKEGIRVKEEEIENNYLKFETEIKSNFLYDFSEEFDKKEPIIKYLEIKKIIENLKDNNKDFILMYEEYKNNKQKDEDYKQKMNMWREFYNKNYVNFDLDKQKKEIKEIINGVSNKLKLDHKDKDIEFIDNNRFVLGNLGKDDIVFDINIDRNDMVIRLLKNRDLDEEDIIKLGYKKIDKEIADYKYIISGIDNYKRYEKFNDYYYDYENSISIELDSNKKIKRMTIKNFDKFLEDKNIKDYKSIIEKDKDVIKKQIKNIKSISPLLNQDEFIYNIYFEDDYSLDVEVKGEEINIKQIYLYKKY